MHLHHITALFDSLNPDQQLLLLDALADRTPYADDICDGIKTAASLAGYDEMFPRDNCRHAEWCAHAKHRDALLEAAISRRAYLDEPEAMACVQSVAGMAA